MYATLYLKLTKRAINNFGRLYVILDGDCMQLLTVVYKSGNL